MKLTHSAHVSSDRLGEAAQHASFDGLRDYERTHLETCEQCKGLYAGYRLTDRLLSASWRQTVLPPSALPQNETRPTLVGLLGSLRPHARSLVPVALALSLAVLVALGVLLPQLMPVPHPAADRSPSNAVATQSFGPVVSPATAATPATAGPVPSGAATGKTPGGIAVAPPTPVSTVTPQAPLSIAGLSGWPVSWAPDGAHLLTAGGSGWTTQRQIKILNSSGKSSGSVTADSATWFDSNTIATSTDGRGPGSDTIRLVNLSGHAVATMPGNHGQGGGGSGAVLLGSGSGDVAVASMGGWGPAQSSFVIWDGQTVGPSHAGIPIGFSQDGRKLAVIHPSGGQGAGFSGWLEIVSVPSLSTEVSYTHTSIHASTPGSGPGYAPEVSFSPDGNWLYVAGTLVDLSHGSTVHVGDGGWLPDGTLLTSSGGNVLRWQGTHSTPDTRFAPGGSVATSRHGEVVEFFGDGRTPLLLTASGTIRQLNLTGVASIDDAQLAPNGAAVAINGRGTNGVGVTELARLR
jgi:hypothetical protein